MTTETPADQLRAALITALDTAHHTHPCPATGSTYWTGCYHPDGTGPSCHSERRADAVLAALPAPALAVARQVLGTTTGQPEGEAAGPVNSGPGWYEVIHPRNATTCIAYVQEDGDLYLPEGDLTPEEFAFAAARGRAHRLVRADEAQQPTPAVVKEHPEAEELVSITRSRLAQLEKDSDKLGALEAYGVDNWEGYDDATAALREATP
ncbi:hypothetical protein C5F59_027620 [Streptomyces sp. QL37]|uniref:hypothetical protein n=1 Tax=Streptomyces sp. QL37 TaxID=2093747 RepID=UPI000CF23A0F|nr:hypothetical protein [Streptomyces sp. QL37]PPQ57119.1 hypothetical protein C5F59_10820 [Streptomyces sp. QL37]